MGRRRGGGLFIIFTAIWEVLLKILRFGRIFLRALVFFFFFPFYTRRECFFFLFANRSLSLSPTFAHSPRRKFSVRITGTIQMGELYSLINDVKRHKITCIRGQKFILKSSKVVICILI